MPKIPFWIFIVLAVLYFSAARVDIMDIDAAQYAEMSREMLHSGDYLHLYDRGHDYLDKPPMLFWVSATSMKVFGVNNFGYRFPSILFALWALYALYRLTKLLYDEKTARMAALILGTCQGMFLMTNDVRTDTVLMSCVITALWMIKECEIKRRWYYVLGGCMSIAAGMMTKGPIALLVPLFCFMSDWVLKRKWNKIFDLRHLIDITIIAVLLIPMSIGLYQQFDLHPEKLVNQTTGVSGLRFFYWSQSFGRITGESPWDNGTHLDFLLSNMLWSYLPWIFLFIPALIINVVTLFKQKFRLFPHQEWVSTGGFILSYLALGSSHYQLPHYIFVAFPLAAIVNANLFRQFFEEHKFAGFRKVMTPVQVVVSFLILIAALLTLVVVFYGGITGIVLWSIAVLICIYVLLNKMIQPKMFWLSVCGITLGNVFLTNHFYYRLLSYQCGSEVGKFIAQQHIPGKNVAYAFINDPMNSLHFYAGDIISRDSVNTIQPGRYLLTSERGLDTITGHHLSYTLLKKGPYFRTSELTGDFLNPKTRDKAVNTYYFVQLK